MFLVNFGDIFFTIRVELENSTNKSFSVTGAGCVGLQFKVQVLCCWILLLVWKLVGSGTSWEGFGDSKCF